MNRKTVQHIRRVSISGVSIISGENVGRRWREFHWEKLWLQTRGMFTAWRDQQTVYSAVRPLCWARKHKDSQRKADRPFHLLRVWISFSDGGKAHRSYSTTEEDPTVTKSQKYTHFSVKQKTILFWYPISRSQKISRDLSSRFLFTKSLPLKTDIHCAAVLMSQMHLEFIRCKERVPKKTNYCRWLRFWLNSHRIGNNQFPHLGWDNLDKPGIAPGSQAKSSRRPKSKVGGSLLVIFACDPRQNVFPELAVASHQKIKPTHQHTKPEIRGNVYLKENIHVNRTSKENDLDAEWGGFD